MGFNPIYAEQLQYLAQVTEMLNTEVPKLPDNTFGYYLRVELVDEDGKTMGYWTDEIADDCWAFVEGISNGV